MRPTDWASPKSVNVNFPPFKDNEQYGQCQVPQFVLDQYQSNVSKVGVVMGWRRLRPTRQKQKNVELVSVEIEKAQKKQQTQHLMAQKKAHPKIDKERHAARCKFEAKRQREIHNQQKLADAQLRYQLTLVSHVGDEELEEGNALDLESQLNTFMQRERLSLATFNIRVRLTNRTSRSGSQIILWMHSISWWRHNLCGGTMH